MNEPFMQKDRKISRFFARQMLFDFHNGELDPIRTKAVKVSLDEDAELKKELDQIDRAEKYCRTLQGTRIRQEFIEELIKETTFREDLSRLSSWRHWPEMARWTVEALAVSAVVVSFIIFVPWKNIGDKMFRRDIFQSAPNSNLSDALLADHKEDEQNRLANIAVEAIEKSIETEMVEPETKKTSETEAIPTQAPKDVVAAVAAKAPVPTQAPVAAEVKTAPVASNQKQVPKGLLYRMMMSVPDIAAKTSDLKRRIQDMGGAKAGNVELGWRKTNGNYFHFSFPESRYQTLLNVLGEYGSVRVYKNPHERVMPEGKIRIILWIEDGGQSQGTEEPQPPGSDGGSSDSDDSGSDSGTTTENSEQ